MCDRSTTLTDPTADFVLSGAFVGYVLGSVHSFVALLCVDLLTATEDLIDFSINVLDTIRLQSHFNDRNRRVNLGSQLHEASEGQKNDSGFVDVSHRSCTVSTTLKYDLSLYLDRILQACKRTKVAARQCVVSDMKRAFFSRQICCYFVSPAHARRIQRCYWSLRRMCAWKD